MHFKNSICIMTTSLGHEFLLKFFSFIILNPEKIFQIGIVYIYWVGYDYLLYREQSLKYLSRSFKYLHYCYMYVCVCEYK